MIKLFRKLRQRLLSENRLGKYLIYAVGEIILVVIGILIALQLNNWNELRKTKILETKTLKELRSDLTQNRDDMETNIESFEACKKANEIIIHHIENNLPYNDSLDFYFSRLYPYTTFSPIQTTFNNLNQTGIKLITNDSLRANISNLYANRFSSYRVFENTYFVEHYTNYIKPMYMNEFVTFEVFESLKPKDYDKFIKNPNYKQIMNYSVTNCQMFIIFQYGLIEEVKALINEIDNEILEKSN